LVLLFVQQDKHAARRGDTETLRCVEATQFLRQEFGEELRDRGRGRSPWRIHRPTRDPSTATPECPCCRVRWLMRRADSLLVHLASASAIANA
jgi:hypothetical protein